MLARSQGPRLDPNQENPHRQPHKTPARPALAGKGAATAGPAPVTGGKGVLGQTARTGRVLGAKDRNQGKQGNAPEPAALLFTGKPSTSTSSQNAEAGPSCQPIQRQPPQQPFKTPLPNRALRPVQDFKTPATALRPKHAPSMLIGSPDVSMEAETEEAQKEPEEDEDREVEYAGGSSRDYDEPYIPDWDEPDYKTAGFGEAAVSMPLVPQIDLEEWLKEDELARKAYKAELDPEIEKPLDLQEDDSPQPLFPLPKRQPLGVKSNNGAKSSSKAPFARPAPTARAPTVAASLGKPPSSTRPPLAPSTNGSAVRRAPGIAASAASSSLRPAATTRPPVSTTSAKPALPSSTFRKPLGGPSTRPAPTSSLGRPRASPPKPLLFSRPSSSASSSAVRTPVSPAQRKAEQDELERELGAFGIVDDGGLDVLAESEGLGARGFMDEEEGEFKLELDL